jgi:hypothetical protein
MYTVYYRTYLETGTDKLHKELQIIQKSPIEVKKLYGDSVYIVAHFTDYERALEKFNTLREIRVRINRERKLARAPEFIRKIKLDNQEKYGFSITSVRPKKKNKRTKRAKRAKR